MQLTGCGMFLHWKPIVWMLRLTKVLNDSFRKCISKLYKGKRWGDAHIFIGMFYRRTVFLTLVPIWNDKYGQISTMHLYKVDTLILLLSVWRRFSLFLANRSSWHFLVHPKCYVKELGGKKYHTDTNCACHNLCWAFGHRSACVTVQNCLSLELYEFIHDMKV